MMRRSLISISRRVSSSGIRTSSLVTSRGAITGLTNPVRSFSANTELVKVLSKEIKDELDAEEQEEPESMKQLQKTIESRGFKIHDTPGHGTVRMEAPGKEGEKIVVTFDVQDLAESDEFDDEYQEGAEGQAEEEEAEEDTTGIHFEVEVIKGDSKLVFECTASPEQIKISDCSLRKVSDDNDKDSTAYTGPVFDELDPGLQDALFDYLAERGIDGDFSDFINMYADTKEQAEFVEWLKKVRKFVS